MDRREKIMIFELKWPTLPFRISARIFMKNQDFSRNFLFFEKISSRSPIIPKEKCVGCLEMILQPKKLKISSIILHEGAKFIYRRSIELYEPQ